MKQAVPWPVRPSPSGARRCCPRVAFLNTGTRWAMAAGRRPLPAETGQVHAQFGVDAKPDAAFLAGGVHGADAHHGVHARVGHRAFFCWPPRTMAPMKQALQPRRRAARGWCRGRRCHPAPWGVTGLTRRRSSEDTASAITASAGADFRAVDNRVDHDLGRACDERRSW